MKCLFICAVNRQTHAQRDWCINCCFVFLGSSLDHVRKIWRLCVLLYVWPRQARTIPSLQLKGALKTYSTQQPFFYGWLRTVRFQCPLCTPSLALTIGWHAMLSLLQQSRPSHSLELRAPRNFSLTVLVGCCSLTFSQSIWAQGHLTGSGQLFPFAIARVWREIGETWTFRKTTTLLAFPRFIFSRFVPARSWCTLKGSLQHWSAFGRQVACSKENHYHFAWHTAADMTILSAKTRSAICFSATYQEGQRAQRAGAEVDIKGGVIFGKICCCFWRAGTYKFTRATGCGCLGVRLPSIVTVSTNFTALCY